jgi:hypothetical protein
MELGIHANSEQKKRERKPLNREELANRRFWEVRYVAEYLGVRRDKVIRKVDRLIERGRFIEGEDYWNAGGEVNNHYLIDKNSGIRKLMLLK